MREKSGITLVALIITIIVLLILAGVAVSTALNEGSVFEKADSARAETNIKASDEARTLNSGLGMLDEFTADAITIITETSQYPKDWDETKLAYVATTGLRTAPIPSGFVASEIEGENTIAGGLVIYQLGSSKQNTEEAMAANALTEVSTEEQHNLAINYLNQFVWIPVEDINQMVMCKDNNKDDDESICNLVLQSDGNLKCMTHYKNDDETELCGRLYGTEMTTSSTGTRSSSNPYIYETSMDFALKNQKWDATDYREPDILEDTTYGDANADSITAINGILATTGKTTWEEELTSSFKEMAESVAKYGGFYIGRYEAGYDSSSYTSYKGQTVMNAQTVENAPNKGANKWYGLYSHLKGTKGGATSSMIWGCQYDQTIKFIGDEAQIGHPDRYLWSSTTKGTTSGYEPNDNTKPIDIMKNIYDLEENYWEWTALANSSTFRSGRGGTYPSVANNLFHPASYRGNYYATDMRASYSSRPTLYI